MNDRAEQISARPDENSLPTYGVYRPVCKVQTSLDFWCVLIEGHPGSHWNPNRHSDDHWNQA